MRTWDPFRDMEALRRELDRALTTYTPSGTAAQSAGAFLPGRSARAYPLVNLSEDSENVYLEALAPGIDPDSLNLTVVRTTLTISGEKLSPVGVSAESFHRSERSGGKFVRSIDLPVEVNSDKVKAQYNNGLLMITMPKAEAAKPRQIKVAVAA